MKFADRQRGHRDEAGSKALSKRGQDDIAESGRESRSEGLGRQLLFGQMQMPHVSDERVKQIWQGQHQVTPDQHP